jgi:hypothetical protein
MIIMTMSPYHGINVRGPATKQLLSEIRRSVDEDSPSGIFDQKRGPQPLNSLTKCVGTPGTATPDLGCSDCIPGPQYGDFHPIASSDGGLHPCCR